jgi:hypothetical protein
VRKDGKPDRRHFATSQAKLVPDQIRYIRSLPLSVPNKAIAMDFGITTAQVSRIRNRKQWAYL